MDGLYSSARPPQSRSCSRARNGRPTSSRRTSGSTTPVLGSIGLSSRPSSPSRLRSLPSVGISNVEAVSDAARAEEATSNVNDVHQYHGHEHRQHTSDGVVEDTGKSKEASLPPPRPVATCKFAEEAIIESGISDYTFIPKNEGGLLGKGKFSSVQLAWKHGVKYAVKITPLYPHHNLIATRLLREPTILAQLPLHPNLVKVYESIRTPGHFYLVEEYLEGYTNLETFVSSQPESRLTISQSRHIFHQLVSVVRSALHEPIQIAHRDIKPENILIHPITLRIILLDFGLATHFSAREPRLTTCCGSPAFHAPELVKSLRSPPGSVRYWGAEIDIWTIGVTVLRCLSGIKYPLGVQHTSLQHLADKTIDAILSIKDKEMRNILAGLLDMDSEKRMDFFRNLPEEIDQIPYKTLDTEEKHDYLITASTASASNGPLPSTANGYNRQFKNTTFIETEPKHSLSLLLAPSASTSASQSGIQQDLPTPYSDNGKLPSFLRSRSQSRDRLSMANGVLGLELSAVDERLEALNGIKATSSAANATISVTSSPTTLTPASPEIILLNPRAEPAMRAISYVKYALRCAGIIYHIQSPASLTDDLAQDKPSLDAPKENLCYPILHCIRVIPSKELEGKSPAASLLNQLRPPLTRAATMGAAAARSSSTPPVRHGGINSGKNKSGKTSDETVRCAELWVQIIPVFAIEEKQHDPANALKNRERSESVKKRPKSKSRGLSAANVHHHHHHHHHEDTRRCTKLRIRISDESLVDVLRKALSGSTSDSTDNYAMYATPPPPRHVALPMTKKSSGDETADTSMEEDRGRPLVSRSRSGEKSRSRSQRRRAQHTSSGSSTSASLTKTNGQKASESSSKSSDTDIPSEESTNGNRQPKNGLLEVRLDSEEEAKLGAQNSNNNIKRGFFDFVSAFNLKTRPTAISTAPSSPAAIREVLEPVGNEGNVTSNMKETFVPPAALAPM